MTGGRINPGSGVLYEAMISSGPHSTVGVYGGTLTVSFTNEFGVASSQSVQVSFTLAGRIAMVVQGEIVTQSSSSNLTISGTLLNEGTVSAYYANAVGYLQGQTPNNALSTYVGEVDVNTPVPFTVTVPYTAGSSTTNANVTLSITYQDRLREECNVSYEHADDFALCIATCPAELSDSNFDANWDESWRWFVFAHYHSNHHCPCCRGCGAQTAWKQRQIQESSGLAVDES